MFNAAKDAFTSKAAQTYINQRIARYGEVQLLKIDSRNKTMEMSCQLAGEPTPVTVRVENYDVREAAGKKLLRIGACVCSRRLPGERGAHLLLLVPLTGPIQSPAICSLGR